MMLHKKVIIITTVRVLPSRKRVHLPDRRKEADELMDEFFPADAIPSNIFQPSKKPHLDLLLSCHRCCTKRFGLPAVSPVFNIDNAVLAGPLINVGKQGPMDLPQAIRRKVLKALFVQQHHICSGLLGLDAINVFSF